jgi:competence protein ComFC
MAILDLVFPKKCVVCKKIGEYICDDCFSYLSFNTENICLVCKNHSKNGLTHKECLGKYSIDGFFSSISNNYTLKKLLFSFKNRPYVSNLKKVLADLFYEGLIQNENFMKELKREEWILVPIPLTKTELKKRGYDQSMLLAEELGKKFNLSVFGILENTGEFKLKPKFKGKLRNVFLVTDLITTGTSLNKATEALKRGGVKRVIGLSLVMQ